MLRALSGQQPPALLVQAVYAETEGNPFFVEEVFQHLAEEGKLFDAQGRWRADLRVGELEVPEGVRLVIGRRLERVCEECRRVLTAAAVIGRGFSFELLDALGQVQTDALLDAVDEAERARLITAASDGPEARFTFAHELIRQTLVSGLSLPRRQRLHLRVAEAMERAYARALEEHAADLAYHLYQAGAAADPEKTVRYLALAGDQALAAAAFEDALRHFENALSLQPADDQRTRADLLFKRGLALRSLGRWEETVADWREALAAYEELDDAEAVGRVCWGMTRLLVWTASYQEAIDTARRGLAVVGEQASADRSRLLAAGGVSHSMSGDHAQATGMFDQAVAMAEELGDQRLLGQVLAYKACHHMWYRQSQQQVEAGLRAVQLLRSAGDLWELADALWYTQYGLLCLGGYDEAAEMAQEAEPLAIRLGHLGALITVRRGSAAREVMLTADIDGYEESARANLELSRAAAGFPWVSMCYTYLGTAHFWRGRWDQALESFREGARLEPPGVLAGYDWAGLFLCQGYMGDKDAALAALEERREGLPRPGRANTWGAWAMLSAAVEGLAVLGEREQAAKLYPLVLEAIDSGPLVLWFSRDFQTVAGIAAAAGGQWDKAEEHYETALRQAHELPIAIAQPEVRRWYARMLIDRARSEHPEPARPSGRRVEGRPSRSSAADLEKARQLLAEAIAMYRELGMPKHQQMAKALLREL